jgi:hypothetical protein
VIVTLVYKDGTRKHKRVTDKAIRIYGSKLNNCRPIKILVPYEARPELISFLETVMDPSAKTNAIIRI